MSKKQEKSFEHYFLKKLIIGIGEVALMADIAPRQIRYWEDKKLIESVSHSEGKNRRYDYVNAMKILMIKQYMDEGFTLDNAAKKIQKKLENSEKEIKIKIK